MNNHLSAGTQLRNETKALVYDYMKNTAECAPYAEGVK